MTEQLGGGGGGGGGMLFSIRIEPGDTEETLAEKRKDLAERVKAYEAETVLHRRARVLVDEYRRHAAKPPKADGWYRVLSRRVHAQDGRITVIDSWMVVAVWDGDADDEYLGCPIEWGERVDLPEDRLVHEEGEKR